MNNRIRIGYKIPAGAPIQKFYDETRNSLKAMPLDKEGGWLAIRRLNKGPTYAHLEKSEFCVISDLSNQYSNVAYWFKNLDTNHRAYIGAILVFKGMLSLKTNYSVIYVLKDGTLIHDMRRSNWSESSYTDMADKIEHEFNLSMSTEIIERHKRVLIKIPDGFEDIDVFVPATGSYDFGSVDSQGYHVIGDNGVLTDSDGVPHTRTRKVVSQPAPTPVENDGVVSLEPWKMFLKENLKLEEPEEVEESVEPEESVEVLKNTIAGLMGVVDDHKKREIELLSLVDTLKLREKTLLNALKEVRKMLND